MTGQGPGGAERAQRLGLDLSEVYASLYRVRRVEEEVARVYWTDVIKSPVHLSIGQEAVSVGVCLALRPDDIVFGTYRGHAMFLAKGGDLRGMVAELYGKATGVTGGKGGSMHLIDVGHHVMGTSAVVGTTIPHAAGYAYALRQHGSDSVVVCFLGDGATEEGVFYETLNFAALQQLPVLFLCENNMYAIHSPVQTRQANPDISDRISRFGVPVQKVVDGDVLSIAEAAMEAVARIRRGEGPQFLECFTYRWKEHVGPGEDFDAGVRSLDEAREWMERDPVRVIGELLSPEARTLVEQDVEKQIADAFEFAERSPFPDVAQLWTDVYAT